MAKKKQDAQKDGNRTRRFTNPPERIGNVVYGVRLDDEQREFANAIWGSDYDIIFCNSKAGCGKTFIATSIANLLVKYGFYDNIIYIMSPYGEQRQGWLPGSIDEKSSVYFEPFYQALRKCKINPNTAIVHTSDDQKNEKAYITCITDTFLRGQNLDDAVIIIDEAQNYTINQLKTTLTRIGSNAKVIVIGHDKQCDLRDTYTSGFIAYMEHFKGRERAAFCNLTINHRGWISQHADEI